MKNNEYSSLTQKLIQSGILQDNNLEREEDSEVNFFNVQNSAIENEETINKINSKRKRINNYDLELLENADCPIEGKHKNNIQKLLYKFFPKLYEFRVAKDAIQKMNELGIDTNALLDKSVPYGEGELRYKNLVKFLQYANEIQSKLKRK